ALRRDQDALGVQAIEQILETLAFLANQVLDGYREIVDEKLGSGVIHHRTDRPNRETTSDSFAHIHKQNGQTFAAFLDLLNRRRSRNQEHEIGMFRARYPDLLAVHDVFVAFSNGRRAELCCVGSSCRLADAKSLEP